MLDPDELPRPQHPGVLRPRLTEYRSFTFPSQKMQIPSRAPDGSRHAATLRIKTRPDLVDRLPAMLVPCSQLFAYTVEIRRHGSIGLRPEIGKIISSPGPIAYQPFQYVGRTAADRRRSAVGPLAADRFALFPGSFRSFFRIAILEFGRKIPQGGAFGPEAQSIVGYQIRLEFADQGIQFRSVDIGAHRPVVAVPPQQVYLSKAGQQFAYLTFHIGMEDFEMLLYRSPFRGHIDVTRNSEGALRPAIAKIAFLQRITEIGPTRRIEQPVTGGIVQSDFQSVLSAGLHVGTHQIASSHVLFGAEIAELARPERITIVMPGGENGITESGPGGSRHPQVRVIILRMEYSRLRQVIFHRPGPFSPSHVAIKAPSEFHFPYGADAPGDKEPQPRIGKPALARGLPDSLLSFEGLCILAFLHSPGQQGGAV